MSHFIENVIIVIVLPLVILNWSCTVNCLSEEQRKEVERLRAELSDAFEKHEDAALAEKGVIVQPAWTKEPVASASPHDAKVDVTKKDLDEVRALRAEINRAVSAGQYVPGVAHTVAGDEQSIRKLDQQLQMKAKGQELLDTLTGAAAAANESELVGAVNANDDGDEYGDAVAAPNVVMANVHDDHIDVRKLQRLEVNKRRTRELLILKAIEEDYSFDLGADVQEWEHIVHGTDEYFIGRRERDLIIAQKRGAKYETVHVLAVGQPIAALETYSYWNHEQQQQEGVLLVASGDRVRWYRRSNTTNQIALYWTWTVGYNVSGLTYFSCEGRDYLAVPSNQSARVGHYALSIYQFELKAREFWIAQRLQLQHRYDAVSLLDTGRDLLLAVAQNHTADIYTFDPRRGDAAVAATDHLRFTLLRRIASAEVGHVSAFQMGGRSYVALGGLQPQILQYEQGDLTPRTMLGSNFGRVELYVPVPVRTYRDDLLLFVQHRVDFESHTLNVVETLIWDGAAFAASMPVPCRLGVHTAYGASCMLDVQRDEGLRGAALLRHGDAVSLIVPRHNAESGLFRLQTQLLAKNSELLDLREIHAFLKDWVREQDELVAQAQHFLAASDTQLQHVTPDLTQLRELKTPQLQFGGQIGELYINDYKWTDEDTRTDLRDVIAAIEQLEADMTAWESRDKRDTTQTAATTATETGDTLAVQSVEVDELTVEYVNGARYFVQDGALRFPGTVNAYNLELRGEQRVQRMQIGELNVDEVTLRGDIEFEHVNGMNWTELRANLVLLTEPQRLQSLRVHGTLVAEQGLHVEQINALHFPADFLWTTTTAGGSNVVRAEKHFRGNLSANVVDTEDQLINGISTLNVVTLSEAQNWTGQPTFEHLEVREQFDLQGRARGRAADELHANPTLEQAHNIAANCYFKQLEVHGTLRLNGALNDEPLGAWLADIVQRPTDAAEPIVIAGAKHFSRCHFPTDFVVADGAISGIPIAQFVTLNTPQLLHISELTRVNIYFERLRLQNGTFDGVDIAELMRTAVRLDAPIVAPDTQLNFAGDIWAPSVAVREALNGVQIAGGYQRLDAPLDLHAAHFAHLTASRLDAPHGVGDGTERGMPEPLLNGVNLRAFLQQRDWLLPSDDGADVHVHVDELQLVEGGGVQADTIGGIPAEYMMHFIDHVDELAAMVLDGSVRVDHIVVDGDVQLDYLNGRHFDDDVQMTAIWLNRPNYLNANVRFHQPPHVHGALHVHGTYNGLPLAAIMDDMVWRTAASSETVLITAPKSFRGDVHVLAAARVAAINGVPVGHIATKRGPLVIDGSLRVGGRMAVSNLTLAGRLNNVSVAELTSRVRYDAALGDFVLLGVQRLRGGGQLRDLSVRGDLNGMEPQLQRFFDQLVYKRHVPRLLAGNYTFTGRVSIEGGLQLRTLNGLDVVQLLDDIVWIDGVQRVPVRIRSPLIFSAAASGGRARVLHVHGQLQTANIDGCSVAHWLNDTLRVDRPQQLSRLTFGVNSLDGNALNVQHLNGIDMSQVITLHTPQNLSGHFHFSVVHLEDEINVGGEVNGIADLQAAYDNTLMLNSSEPQHVLTPLRLRDVHVLGDVLTTAPVNGDKDLRDVATLQGPLEFESPLYFEDVRVHGGVYTNDLIAGVDMDAWQREALWLRKRPRQWIDGEWRTQQLTVRQGGSVAGAPLRSHTNAARSSRRAAPLCQQAQRLWQRYEQRAYTLKYLERRFVIALNATSSSSSGGDVLRVYALRVPSIGHFLLVNDAMRCQTRLYQWQGQQRRYAHVADALTGAWTKVLPLANVGEFISLGAGANRCRMDGLHAWRVQESQSHGTYRIAHQRRYELNGVVHDVTRLAHAAPHFYATANATLYEFNAAGNASTTTPQRQWRPLGVPHTPLRFVPHHALVMLTNGTQLYWLRAERTLNHSGGGDDDDVQQHRPTILRAIDGIERDMTYAEFAGILARTLLDLNQRLQQQVNITQLSVPESDLYDDEHLLRDFIDVMAELQRQRVYPADMFADMRLDQLRLPDNSAQALAAHVVLEAWPVIVELQDMQQQLRANATTAQLLCACAMARLGALVRDVLLLANRHALIGGSEAQAEQLHTVIERVRAFQAYALQRANELQADVERFPLTGNATTIVQHESCEFCSSVEAELLPLTVGNSSAPLQLLAVIVSVVNGSERGIRLYTAPRTGELYQTLNTTPQQPHALATLRVRDDTLLAYVLDCCRVHVLVHRQAAGFVPFAQFEHASPVRQLLGLRLPESAAGGVTHSHFYLAAVQSDALVFYELLLNGKLIDFPATICN